MSFVQLKNVSYDNTHTLWGHFKLSNITIKFLKTYILKAKITN